jgi:dipeptidyl aminopeptidase/acylaminoacyl peptidase
MAGPLSPEALRACLARFAPVEEPCTYAVEGERLAARLFLPEPAGGPCPAVVIAHGFTGSRNADARLLTWLGRALARAGIGALAPDFRGSGESEGDFLRMRPSTEVADARAGLDLLAADPRVDGGRLGMVGHSLGGLVTVLTAAADARLRAVVLWAAVAEQDVFAGFLQEEAENRTAAGWDVGGLEAGEGLAEECLSLAIQEAFARSSAPALILHGEADETVPVAHARRFAATAEAAARAHRLHLIAGADHCFRSLPWRQELLGETLAWCRRHLAPTD